jgi:hypothetical protein
MIGYEDTLGVPQEFIRRLLFEPDDWSFVLKLHALLEGALNRKLLELIGKPALEKPFRRIQMRTMIAFAESLAAISKRAALFLEGLGELRNRLVHDVSSVTFELDQWASDGSTTSVRSKLIGPDARKGLAMAGPINPYRFVLWGQALAAMEELQSATVANRQRFSATIDADVERRGRVESAAMRTALSKLLAERAESTDNE